MKLLNSFGPNPRMVRMFLSEKNIQLKVVEHDILAAENRGEDYAKKNPGQQFPALELDDGFIIAETVVMCEYLEDRYPTPSLIGTSSIERAEARMWNRRIELKITENMYSGFRFGEGLEMFKDRMRCLPEAADGLKASAQDGLKWFDEQISAKEFICGDRITLGDLVLYCCVDFAAGVGQPVDESLKNLTQWFVRMQSRPSAEASLHPGSSKLGMRG